MINKMKLNMNSMIQVTKKPFFIGAFCLTLNLVAFSAQADGYAGVSAAYSDSEYQASTGWLDSSPALAQIQFGYFFSDYVAIEGRYATSVNRSDGLAIDGLASALVKANMPVTDRLALYALAGYSYARADYQHQTTNDSGATFGVGLHYALSGKTAITGEFVNYLAGDDLRLTALQFGVQFKF